MRFTFGPGCCLFIAPSPMVATRYDSFQPVMMRGALPAEGVQKTVRKYFPETWIWDLVPLE